MSIAMELMAQLENLADEHEMEKIESVTMQAGVMRGIVPEAMQIAFEAAAMGTRMQGATLDLEITVAQAECRLCKHGFEPAVDSFLCPRCGQADVSLTAGDEIILASVAGRTHKEMEAS